MDVGARFDFFVTLLAAFDLVLLYAFGFISKLLHACVLLEF